MPIVELRTSLDTINRGGGVQEAQKFCRAYKEDVIRGFKIPDENDFETRVTRVDDEPTSIRCDLTEGPEEYPKHKGREALFPSESEVSGVGEVLQSKGKESKFRVERTEVTVWPDTTFLLQEEDGVGIPVKPENLELLQDSARRIIGDLEIKLVVSPEVIASSGGIKEGEPSEVLGSKIDEISLAIHEALGTDPESMGRSQMEVALAADTPVSLEFDCVTRDGDMSEDMREYVAEVALHTLHTRFNTNKEEAAVWIRQNRPNATVITL